MPTTQLMFYTTEQLGPNRHKTPEGYLLCTDVPLARTGTMLYAPGETPVSAGPDGVVYITRDSDEVFNPKFLASLNGKPLVDTHPGRDVSPENWRELTKGIVLNPRRGQGADSDLILGDVLVTDSEMIKELCADNDVYGMRREVSVGYEADYTELSPGRGRQSNMIANHVAIVAAGRCGSRCAIGDCERIQRKPLMKTLRDLFRDAFKSKDESAFATLLEKVPDTAVASSTTDANAPGTHIHVHSTKDGEATADTLKSIGDKVAAIDARTTADAIAKAVTDAVAKAFKARDAHDFVDEDGDGKCDTCGKPKSEHSTEDAKRTKDAHAFVDDDNDGKCDTCGKPKDEHSTEDRKKVGDARTVDAEFEAALVGELPEGFDRTKVKDSVPLSESFQETAALADIIAPGISIPTYDAAHAPKDTVAKICNLRKRALDAAYAQQDTRNVIDQLMAGRTFDTKTMTCDAARSIFRAVGTIKQTQNKQSVTAGFYTDSVGSGGGSGVRGKLRTPADLNKLMAEKYKN